MSQIEKSEHVNIDAIRNLHRWRMAFFGVVILLAGMVIGGASMMILAPHKLMTPPPGPEFESMRMLPSLRRDLGLTPEQTEKIEPILEKYMQKLAEIRLEARDEVAQTLKQMNEDISDILSDRQEREWGRRLERLQRDLRPGRGGPGRRGAGPGGPRQGRGMQERRGFGRRGPWRRLDGPNMPRDVTEPNSSLAEEKPDANGME